MSLDLDLEPPRIALILDNPLRDLPGLCLLALELCSRGCKTFLTPMYLNDEVFSFAPDYVVVNYLRKSSRGYVQALAANGIQYGVLDTEGGPMKDMERKYASLFCDDRDLTAQAACVCTWGSEASEISKRLGLFRDRAVIQTGPPRFDIYSIPWSNVSSEMAGYVKSVPGPFVLICSNFALTTSQYGNREQSMQSLVKNYGFAEAEVRQWQDEEEEAISKMIDCVLRLAALFPKTAFVYRPHPFERTDVYGAFSQKKNISLSKQGDISAWLLGAAAVIQLNCTTCYDAFFAETPSLKPGWISQESGMGSALAINHVCQTFEELAGNVEAAIQGRYDIKLNQTDRNIELARRFCGAKDGNAHCRAADGILNSLNLDSRKRRFQALAGIKEESLAVRAEGWKGLKSRMQDWRKMQSTWNPKNAPQRQDLIKRYAESPKFFAPDLVAAWTGRFAKVSGKSTPTIQWAEEAGEYPFGGKHGKSVVIKPQENK